MKLSRYLKKGAGRVPNVLKFNRHETFRKIGTLLRDGVFPQWVESAILNMSDWKNEYCRGTFDMIGVMFGEITAAGALEFEAAPVEQQLLALEPDALARLAQAQAARKLPESVIYRTIANILYYHVAPVWKDRALEALTPGHEFYSHVFFGFGNTVKGVVAAGTELSRRAAFKALAPETGPIAPPPPECEGKSLDAAERRASASAGAIN